MKRILKDAGYDPGPKRGEGTWDEFLKQHAASLWQCDFFSKRIVTMRGIRDAFVLVFLNVKTRQVVIGRFKCSQLRAEWGSRGKENELLVVRRRRKKNPPAAEVISMAEVRGQQQLGGLLKHYYRKAA